MTAAAGRVKTIITDCGSVRGGNSSRGRARKMTSTSLTDADLDKLQQLLENIGATEVPKTKAAEESRK